MDRECTHKEKRCLYRDYDHVNAGALCGYGSECLLDMDIKAKTGKEIMADFVKRLSHADKVVLRAYLKDKLGD